MSPGSLLVDRNKGPLAKLISNPALYLRVAGKVMLQKLCWLFKDASFFLQGQMDINPRSRWYHGSEIVAKTGGLYLKADKVERRIYDLDAHDNVRRDMLVLLLRTLIERKTEGAFAEVGVYQGWTAKLIHHYAPERRLHLFDTFEGFTQRSAVAEANSTGFQVGAAEFSDTSLEKVRSYVRQQNENVSYHRGYFPDSIPPQLREERFAFVHLDADLYEPIWAGLEFFYPRMVKGGLLVVHDYNAWIGSRTAVDRFFGDKSEVPIPMPDQSGSVLIIKQ
jgi:O-methyltransferase